MKNKKKQKRFTKKSAASFATSHDFALLAHTKHIVTKLGLQDFLHTFSTYFARKLDHNSFFTESIHTTDASQSTAHNNTFFCSDTKLSYMLAMPSCEKLQQLILSLDSYKNIESMKLPKVAALEKEILHLAKGGILRLYDVFLCLQMVQFFYDCTKREDIQEGYFYEYLQKFIFPKEILSLLSLFIFDNKTHIDSQTSAQLYLKSEADKELALLYAALEKKQKQKEEALYTTLHTHTLQEYLVDRQIHFFENETTLLVRPGYAKILQARVVGRSVHGFFYIVPLSLDSIQTEIHILYDKIEERLHFLAKEYSKILAQYAHFLRFVHTEYDFMDKALARLHFARDYNLSFVFANTKNTKSPIILHDYMHPSLKNPIPLSVRMDRNLLLITGVNAGGKTMLLKSIVSALWCAKFYIPMRINAHKSSLPFIQNIHIIAQDPQDSHNDISTFSGRIRELSAVLEQKELLLGIDEIEIGTDSSEAASLYKVLLERLLDNGAKIVVTTHHKHLAALMASHAETKLLAAVYDYERGKPTFSFIDGIGKSYAMECALQYGIPKDLIMEAKRVHGSEANRLECLIEESNLQITRNRQDSLKLQELIAQEKQKIQELESAKSELQEAFQKQSLELKRHYNEAIKEVKMLARQSQHNLEAFGTKKGFDSVAANEAQEIIKKTHRLLNKAQKNEKKTPTMQTEASKTYTQGEWVRYKDKQAKVIECGNDTYTIELQNGMRLKNVKAWNLKPLSPADKQRMQAQIHARPYELEADIRAHTTLDLHGYTREEALELLENFLNQAIMARFSEVLVIHGVGSGTLRAMVDDFLKKCNYIRGYIQAPPNMGGLGGKIIYL